MTTKPPVMVTVTMTEEQARVVMDSLELYTRLSLGQIESLKYVGSVWKNIDHNAFEDAEIHMKHVLFPELARFESYGIYQKEAGRNAQIAWDILQSIRHPLSWFLHPEGGITVNFGEPMLTCEGCKFPTVTVCEGDA
jgi:hypothetical protein